jgi:uncharacterized protein YcnI
MQHMQKVKRVFISVFGLFLSFVSLASAHVTVTPSGVGVGAWEHFSVGVPSERSVSTVGIRLVVPEGLAYVTPNVKPGWKIDTKKDDKGNITEINWTGSEIPGGQRDEFQFSAKTPSDGGEIIWKAYQTYQDGSVVSWDNDPKAEQAKDSEGKADFSKVGPYSVTKVSNDFANEEQTTVKEDEPSSKPAPTTVISIAALAVAIIALIKTSRK